MGRLTLNVLLSFAQFGREVTGERIRDEISASKKKGMWMGGVVPLGYWVEDRALHVVEDRSAAHAPQGSEIAAPFRPPARPAARSRILVGPVAFTRGRRDRGWSPLQDGER